MKSFYAFGKFWAVLLLSLVIENAALGAGSTPSTAAGITAQTTAFLQKFAQARASGTKVILAN